MTQATRNSTLALMVLSAIAAMVPTRQAYADDQTQPTKLEKIEVTGSLIKRSIDDEGALPVTIIRSEDIARTGATSIEQMLAFIPGNQPSQGVSQAIGASTGGQSTVNLRGLGPNYTLVLLNGQRFANFAYAPGSADINSIPLAAIDRIEILHDGASAVYGSDAIGGVINFITKKDFQGISLSADSNMTEEAGGKTDHVTATAGLGSLDKDGYNLMGSYNLERQSELKTTQRNFSLLASASPISSNTNPANYRQPSTNIGYNPSLPGCTPPFNVPAGNSCRAASALYFDLIPYNLSDSIFLKGTFKLPGENVAALEYFRAEHNVLAQISPDPHGTLTMPSTNPYFPGAGITPAPPASLGTLDQSTLNIKWRVVPNGDRADNSVATEDRIAATLKGTLFDSWDYSTALFTTHSRVHQNFQSGYTNDAALQDLLNGTNTQGLNPNNLFVNPFGANTAAATAALGAAKITGEIINAQLQSTGANAQVQHEFFDLPGGAFAVSAGLEFRKESFVYNVNDPLAAISFTSSGIAPGSSVPEHSRNVTALFLEALAPITKELEADFALRTDHYDGFGSTTNPKFALRYQPIKEFLIRGSAAKGFRAPDLDQLYAPQSVTNTAGKYNDPTLCPNGNPINANVDPTISCNVQQNLLTGGNPNLKPEKSTQFDLGFVVQPIKEFKATADLWDVKITDQIRTPGEGALYNNYGTFASDFVRCSNGALASLSTSCVTGARTDNLAYAIDSLANIGEIDARGVDLSLSYALLNDYGKWTGEYDVSYISKYDYQLYTGAPFVSNVGVYSNDLNQPIFRWQHTLALNWRGGDWSADVVNRFRSGYDDANPNGEGHHVPQFWNWDVAGAYYGFKNLTLSAAVRNLFNKDPPYSNQTNTFQLGYDPTVSSPLGRIVFVGAKLDFK